MELHFGETMTLTANDEGQMSALQRFQWAAYPAWQTTVTPCADDIDPTEQRSDRMWYDKPQQCITIVKYT